MTNRKERIRKTIIASVLVLAVAIMYCLPTAVMAADGTEQTQAATQYTISFDLNGASGTAPEAKTVDDGTTVSFDTVTRSGYNFKGWSADKNATSGVMSITANANATYYAVWAKTYTITFSSNGGSVTAPAAASYEEGESVTMPAYTGTSSAGTFVGWSTDKDANAATSAHYTNLVYPAASTAYTMGSKDVTFYAIYSKENITAKFFVRIDGKIPAVTNGYSSNQYTAESAAMTVENAIKVGQYKVDRTDGVSSGLSALPSDEAIKAACSGKNISYNSETQKVFWYVIKHENDGWHVDGVLVNKEFVKLLYEANTPSGSTFTGKIPDGVTAEKDAVKTVSQGTDMTASGYVFTGWNTQADGNGTAYAAGSEITLKDSTTTLYAQWEKTYTVTINYVDENGDKIDGTTSYVKEGLKDGTDYAQASPSIDGYTILDSSQATVAGAIAGKDVTVNVVYVKNTTSTPTTPETPTTPATPITPTDPVPADPTEPVTPSDPVTPASPTPSTSSTVTTTSTTPASDASPTTGDTSDMGVFGLMALIGACGAAAMLIMRRKEAQEDAE